MRFLKYAPQQIKFRLIDTNDKINEFLDNVRQANQFWEKLLSIDIGNEKVFIQKRNYIHNNSVRYPWNLIQHDEEYKYFIKRNFTKQGSNKIDQSLQFLQIVQVLAFVLCNMAKISTRS